MNTFIQAYTQGREAALEKFSFINKLLGRGAVPTPSVIGPQTFGQSFGTELKNQAPGLAVQAALPIGLSMMSRGTETPPKA